MSKVYYVQFSGRDSAGFVTQFRYATQSFVPPPGSSISGSYMEGRVDQPLLMRRDLYGQGNLYGDPEIAHGSIILQNADGGLDTLLNYAFDTQTVIVAVTDTTSTSEPRLVFGGTVEQVVFDTQTVTLLVRDYTYILDKPLQSVKYAGNNVLPNGLEGTSELKGKPKPMLFGQAKNITPVLVNSSLLIYQVNGDERAADVQNVYDMMSQLTEGAQYTSTADLLTNAPAPFTWRQYPAGGYFRLGSSPAGMITADAQGFNQGSIGTPVDPIDYLLLREYLGYTRDNQIPTVNFFSFSDRLNLSGAYYTEETTVYSAIREMLAGMNSGIQTYPATATVFVTFARLGVPGTTTPVLSLDSSNIVPGSLKNVVPSNLERGIPPWRIRVRGDKNYTVMSDSDIAGSVSAAVRADAIAEYREGDSDENNALLTQYPNAPQLNLDILGTFGLELANYFGDVLSGPKRTLLSLQVPLSTVDSLTASRSSKTVYGPILGTEFTVTYPRYKLNAGVSCVLIGYSLDYKAQVADLLLFGILP